MTNHISMLLRQDQIANQVIQRRCFIASSLKNSSLVALAAEQLRRSGFFVYDFTRSSLMKVAANPHLLNELTTESVMQLPELKDDALSSRAMLDSMGQADILLVILPAGFSAGWEVGYASARGVSVIVDCEGTRLTDVPLYHAEKICKTLAEAIAYIQERQ